MWGAKPPTFLDGFKAPRGRPDPKNRPKKFRPDCLQVPRVCERSSQDGKGWSAEKAALALPLPHPPAMSKYSGGPHIRFPFWGEGSLWILGFGVPSRPNPLSGAVKSVVPGPREGSSILNAHLVVMSAAVFVLRPLPSARPIN